jgi:hypothetical protein
MQNARRVAKRWRKHLLFNLHHNVLVDWRKRTKTPG